MRKLGRYPARAYSQIAVAVVLAVSVAVPTLSAEVSEKSVSMDVEEGWAPLTPAVSLASIERPALTAASSLPFEVAAPLATSAFAALPDDAFLEAHGAVIGEVSIRVIDIFDAEDPEENQRLFQMVNRLHRKTHDSVVRRQLLFAAGDPYSPRLLRESERMLRRNRYLYDAAIRPVRYRGNRVDVEVAVKDVWTLTGGVEFSRSGGENAVEFEIQDYNVFGTGKDITVNRSTDVDRTSSLVRYSDNNFLGGRSRLELWTRQNSDGDGYLFKWQLPFYALDARRAHGIKWRMEDRVDPLYSLGEIRSEFRHETELFEAFWGFSRGLENGRSRRLSFGLTYDRHIFSEPLEPSPERPPPAQLPADRTLVYPWIGFEWVEDRFVEMRDFDRMGRTEDLNLGLSLHARLGWSSSAFGGDLDAAVFASGVEVGHSLGRRQLLLSAARFSGRWGADGGENLELGATLRYFWRNWRDHLLSVRFEIAAAHEMDSERQLLLGGDSGLRGYPLRYQEGDRRFLLTIEQRFFTNWHLLRLVHVGAAVFFDVGRAWFEDGDQVTDRGWLRDVGFGLRLSPSRSGKGTMIHLDVAFPLDGGDGIRDVQWLVSSKDTF